MREGKKKSSVAIKTEVQINPLAPSTPCPQGLLTSPLLHTKPSFARKETEARSQLHAERLQQGSCWKPEVLAPRCTCRGAFARRMVGGKQGSRGKLPCQHCPASTKPEQRPDVDQGWG